MREIRLVVTLQVDDDGKFEEPELQAAAVAAITDALQFAENQGFSHPLADDISISFVSAEDMSPALSGLFDMDSSELTDFCDEAGRLGLFPRHP
jgi:hypothetical protein